MPHTPELHIVRAWRYRTEPGRIHFMLTTHEGQKRHLYVPNESPIGQVLDAALQAQGYTGPRSGEESSDEADGLEAEPV
jgi:hypothetical protein